MYRIVINRVVICKILRWSGVLTLKRCDLYINMFQPSALLIKILIKFSAVNIKK
jgi:hypothetical protein